MENLCLEDFWNDKLSKEQWSQNVIQRFLTSLASSTWISYNRCFRDYLQFTVEIGVQPDQVSQGVMADFLTLAANKSRRPKSVLNSTTAALNNYFRAVDVVSPINQDVQKLVEGLIKSGTLDPMKRTKVIPTHPFMELFRSWGDNLSLSTWALRLKSIVLMSLAFMLRPSDVAPHSRNCKESVLMPNVFRRSSLNFTADGFLEVYFFGIKNDYEREGFHVRLPQAASTVVCPVRALRIMSPELNI